MKRKRTSALALLCAAALLLSACGETGPQPPEGACKVYYAVTGEKSTALAVDFEYRVPEEGKDPAAALAELALGAPQTAGLRSPARRTGAGLLSCELEEEGRLHLDLSEPYGGLSGVELTVANACLTLTLSQLEGVRSVAITVEGEPLPYQTLQPLRESDFLLAGEEEAEQFVTVGLCFPLAGEEGLGVERRAVLKSGNGTLAAAVVGALLEGPQSQDLRDLAPQGAVLRSAEVEDGVCCVDLSEDFQTGLPEDGEEASLLLYAITDTLCTVEGLEVRSVQFLIGGRRVESLGGLDTGAPLKPDISLIRK